MRLLDGSKAFTDEKMNLSTCVQSPTTGSSKDGFGSGNHAVMITAFTVDEDPYEKVEAFLLNNRVSMPSKRHYYREMKMDELRLPSLSDFTTLSMATNNFSDAINLVIKQFSASGYEHSDVMVIDELEMQRHQHLEKLYRSTRSGKEFQRELVKAAEAFSSIGYKHIEAGTKLSEECCKYGVENADDEILAKAASIYGDARKHVEKEQEDFTRLLFSQILEPLRAMIVGAPLEDARHLAQRYSRMRQEAETQVILL
ncbi:SH3 domain-containing protein 3 [Tanacetum coccineum]